MKNTPLLLLIALFAITIAGIAHAKTSSALLLTLKAPAATSATNSILMEDGASYILLESGDRILLE